MKAWVLSDGAAGNARQAMALAEALARTVPETSGPGLSCEVRHLKLRWPATWWAPRLGTLADVRDRDGAMLQPPWPEIAIGCGRVAALATRCLRSRGVRVAQILDPRIDARSFDALIVPAHDAVAGANVVVTLGSLHGIDDRWLAHARQQFAGLHEHPSPRTAVLVGGPVRRLPWTRRDLDRMIVILRHWLGRDGGSLMFSTSRRTPVWAQRKLREAFADSAALFHTPADRDDNPYPGLLAHADRIVVTGDSVNMISEACAVGVPVLCHAPGAASGRLGAFHRALLQSGHIRPLRLEYTPVRVEPLREMDAVVARTAQLLGLNPGPSVTDS
ncbi:MAG TPA: mitochondrial fission ELM1 family protein [Xanthomonadaceae bacterium]|nr:mitochondrial fission ELM1 family protein [Xanthomonadaceae bacterium]